MNAYNARANKVMGTCRSMHKAYPRKFGIIGELKPDAARAGQFTRAVTKTVINRGRQSPFVSAAAMP